MNERFWCDAGHLQPSSPIVQELQFQQVRLLLPSTFGSCCCSAVAFTMLVVKLSCFALTSDLYVVEVSVKGGHCTQAVLSPSGRRELMSVV